MRITPFIIFNRMVRSFQISYRNLSNAHERMASGKRINRPSDDVVGLSKAMRYNRGIGENERYGKNIGEAMDQLAFIEGVMNSTTIALSRLQELAIGGATGTQNDASREATKKEVDNLKEHMVGLANGTHMGKYVFSGFSTDLQAVNLAAGAGYTDGLIDNTGDVEVAIDRDTNVAINVSVNTAFRTQAGNKSFFDIIQDLSVGLGNNDAAAIQVVIGELEGAIERAVNVRADVGSRMNMLENQRERFLDNNLTLTRSLSGVMDADFAKAASDIAKSETALFALRESASRVIAQSLMDFLR